MTPDKLLALCQKTLRLPAGIFRPRKRPRYPLENSKILDYMGLESMTGEAKGSWYGPCSFLDTLVVTHQVERISSLLFCLHGVPKSGKGWKMNERRT